MKKIVIVVCIIIAILLIIDLCTIAYFYFDNARMEDKNQKEVYQGPVRPTDDLEHFRKTGETKPKNIDG